MMFGAPVLWLAASAGLHGFAQAPPVFASSVEYVHVDVFVSQGERSVPGLRAADFELRDDGVPQSPELISAESRPVQAALVFDTSSSVAGDKMAALRSAGAAFLDGLGPKDEASLFAFSEEIAWRARPTTDKQVVRESLSGVRALGATSAYDALYAALALADPQMPSLIALFTDGEDNVSILDAEQVRNVAERSSSLVHVVSASLPEGAAGRDTAGVLREIAEHSGGRFWTAGTSKDLRAAFAAIAASMGERYVLRYQPRGVKRTGWHPLAVKLRNVKGRVRARRGYWVAEGRDLK
jgi:VWFA-related protein